MRDVYSRRMFQAGGEVLQSKPIFSGGRVPTPAGTESIERVDTEDGTEFFFVVRGNDGEVRSSRAIDLNLAPSVDEFGNPRSLEERALEANIRERQQGGLELAGTLATAPILMRLGGAGILSGLTRGAAKIIPKFKRNPLLRRGDVEIPKGVMQGAGKLELGPAGQLIGSAGAIGGASTVFDAATLDAEEIAALDEEKIQAKEQQEASEVQEELDALTADPVSTPAPAPTPAPEDKSEIKNDEYEATVKELEKELKKENRAKRFGRLTSALSNFYEPGMTRAEGMISLGKKLSEETEKEQKAIEAQAKKELEAREKLFGNFAENRFDYEQDLSDAIKELDTVDVGITVLREALGLVEEGGVAGFFPQLDELISRGAQYFNIPYPENNRMKAKLLLRYFAQGQVKNITGESGRTISNVDRQIAQQLVGDIDNIFATEKEIKGNLERTLDTFLASYRQANRDFGRARSRFTDLGLEAPYSRNIADPDVEGTNATDFITKEESQKRLDAIKTGQ